MTVIDEYLKKRTDLRSLTGHTDFHDGVSNTYLDSSRVELGKIHVLGKGHTYVVMGRTGKYCGAEGTMTTNWSTLRNSFFVILIDSWNNSSSEEEPIPLDSVDPGELA